MPHPLALAALAGLVSSVLFLALSSGVPGVVLLAYFVQLPIMFTGLVLGPAGSALAAVSAILVNGLLAGLFATALYAVVQAAPALLLVRQALLSRAVAGKVEWFPPGLLLAQLTLLAVAAIAVAFVLFSGQAGGLEGVIEGFLASALAELGTIPEGSSLPAEARGIAFLLPGLIASSWLMMTAVNAILAQRLAVRAGWNRRPSPDLARLELPWWLWPVLGAAALLSLLGGAAGFLGRSAMIVLAVPYFFLGLAVLHSLARRLSHRRLALFALYTCIVVLGWPGLMVVLLGFVEDWANLRRRLT